MKRMNYVPNYTLRHNEVNHLKYHNNLSIKIILNKGEVTEIFYRAVTSDKESSRLRTCGECSMIKVSDMIRIQTK